MCRRTQKSSCSTAIAGHGFIHAMTTQDRQNEMGAILAQIAMIAEEVNVLAGSGGVRTCAHQMAIIAEVQLRAVAMTKLCLKMAMLIGTPES